MGVKIFWREELHHPALFALTRTSRLNAMLGQDAAIAGNPTTRAAAELALQKRPASSDHGPGAQRASAKPRSTRPDFRAVARTGAPPQGPRKGGKAKGRGNST
eukprot:4479658-Amphidinium_carterae.1